MKTPVVTKKETSAVEVAGESTTDTSTALAIPTSIKPKLPTQDDSQIVGDLDYPYFVTIKHPQLGKYLIYKPTTSPVVSLEAPRLTYRSRVQKYLNNPDQALEKDGYTEQHSDRPSILAKIKALKAFPHAADWLLKSLGVADTFTDKRGKAIPRLTLMGQIQPKNAKPIDGVFQWGFLPGTGTQTCYHRSGTEKVPEAMIGEYQQRQFNVEFPPLPDNGNGN